MTNRRDMMADYVTVAERIQAFYDRFPNGSLQSEVYLLTEEIVVMKSYAYRTADDARPGIGHSSMLIPGSTNFTRGSEIENCESSSVGRAIAMLGFEVKRGIATREEVDNKQNEHERPIRPPQSRNALHAPVAASGEELDAFIAEMGTEHGLGIEQIVEMLGGISPERFNALTPTQLGRARTTILEKLGATA